VKMGKVIVGLLMVLLLSGCLGPVAPAQKTQYTLALKNYHNHVSSRPITVLVATPTASPGYDSRRMLYTCRPYEIKAFAKNEWAGSPANLLQPVIIQALRDTGHFRAVVASPLPARRDYLLKTNLVELRQDFTYKPSCIKMALQAELIENRNRQVVASKIFSTEIPTISNDPYGGVLAANRATTFILGQLTRFCTRHLVHFASLKLPKPKQFVQLPTPQIFK